MTEQTRQNEVQALSEVTLEEAIAKMRNAGLEPHEIAQAMILTGAGLLAGALGPKQAGHDLHNVADQTAAWIRQIADGIENS